MLNSPLNMNEFIVPEYFHVLIITIIKREELLRNIQKEF